MYILISIILLILIIFVVASYYLQPFGQFAISSKPGAFYLLVIILVILFGLSLVTGIKNLTSPYQTLIQIESGNSVQLVDGIEGEAMFLHEERFRAEKKFNMPLFTWDNIPEGKITVKYIKDGEVKKTTKVDAQINAFYNHVKNELDAKFCYYFPVTFPSTGDWELEFVTKDGTLGPLEVHVFERLY